MKGESAKQWGRTSIQAEGTACADVLGRVGGGGGGGGEPEFPVAVAQWLGAG